MKGISNILPSFTRTVLCVLCALGLSLGAYAQSRTATVNVKDVTVKELLKAIEAGSSYTFAYGRIQGPEDPFEQKGSGSQT